MALPLIVAKSTLQPFSFYHEGSICRGVHFQKGIFKLIGEFSAKERHKAYEKACKLAVQGSVIVAVGPHKSQVWADLSIPAAPLAISSVDPNGALFGSYAYEDKMAA